MYAPVSWLAQTPGVLGSAMSRWDRLKRATRPARVVTGSNTYTHCFSVPGRGVSLRDIAGSKIMCSQIKELWSDCPRSVHTYTSALRVAPCGVLQGAESVPYGCLMQAHELSLLSLGRDNITTPNYSLNTHAPDQTGSRSRVLHCDDDLTALDHYYHNPTRFS